MPTAIAETTLNAEPKRRIVERMTALLIATDGTPQSDAAIALARLLPLAGHGGIKILTVVDRVPIPWGNVNPSVAIDYERGLREEAESRARAQIDRLGDKSWTVEVRSGDPATTIATLAKNSNAGLVLVGLGGHGLAARLFGNETALKLMGVSQTPVLAVDAKLRALPERIVVAMDFREASIEAARLALEIAAPGATVTLVHVVPWERKEYIPEQWLREHETNVGAQLTRVTGWLDRGNEFRINHRVLYGRPGPALLACAEELDADLIVAGTHGRGTLGRILGDQTLAKLVRGARRSMLVRPAASAFQGFHHAEPDSESSQGEADWAKKLEDFSRRNAGRRGRLEVDDPELGAQVEMRGYRFLGAAYDSRSKRAQLMFGDLEGTGPHLVRGISNIKSIGVLPDGRDDWDTALSIVSDDGQTLLVLDNIKEAR
jgi:nucleotide-binding universal stress UspA family protein